MIAAMVAIVVVVVVMVVAVLVFHHVATLMSSWNRSSTGGNDVGSGDACSARDAASLHEGCACGDPPTPAALLAQISTAAATAALAALDPPSRCCHARCGGGDESCWPEGSRQREERHPRHGAEPLAQAPSSRMGQRASLEQRCRCGVG
jgi:hypothetical protein